MHDHDTTPTHRPCHGCGATLDENEITWARPDGSLSVDDGDPYCDNCLPEQQEDDDTTPQDDAPVAIWLARSEWLDIEAVLRRLAEDEQERADESDEWSDEIREEIRNGARWLSGVADTIIAKTGERR